MSPIKDEKESLQKALNEKQAENQKLQIDLKNKISELEKCLEEKTQKLNFI
jgi:hypothetical protein